MVGTGDGHACCWAWSACRVAPRWLVGRASRSPKRLALILRIDASSERKGVGSARVLRWRPRGVDGGICPKRDAADPEPEPARRPGDGDGAGGGYSEGENRRWGLVAVAADDTDRPSIAEDGGPRTGEPDAAASGLELVRGGGGGARRSWSIAPDC